MHNYFLGSSIKTEGKNMNELGSVVSNLWFTDSVYYILSDSSSNV